MTLFERIMEEAIQAQDSNKYGLFTNPYILGLLTAAEMVREAE